MQTVREWLVEFHQDIAEHPRLIETASPQNLRDYVPRRRLPGAPNPLHEAIPPAETFVSSDAPCGALYLPPTPEGLGALAPGCPPRSGGDAEQF